MTTKKDFVFKGQGKNDPNQQAFWEGLKRLPLPQMDNPAGYHSEDEGLISAVNTALSLGMPLLLTGAPGVGKTQLAYRIAYELGCRTIFFPVKSDSEAQHLFYHIDYLRRLHVAQLEPKTTSAAAGNLDEAVDLRKFIRFQGLGLAILRAMPEQKLTDLGLRELAWPDETPKSRQPSVVLIDEIDKAPNDFPNDLLEEIRRLRFDVPDLDTGPLSIYTNSNADLDDPKQQQKQQKEQRYRPIIIITSNSEKTLPEPFLRRCVYYDMRSPDRTTLTTIIQQRLAKHSDLTPALQQQCLSFFLYLRDQATLEKKPSTGELLSWLLALSKVKLPLLTEHTPPTESEAWQRIAAHCLLKRELDQDQQKVKALVELWWEHYLLESASSDKPVTAPAAKIKLWTDILTRLDDFLYKWQPSPSSSSSSSQRLTPEQHLQCYALFRYWYEYDDYPQDHAAYGRSLGPLLCQNEDEQRRFQQEWRQFWKLPEPTPTPTHKPPRPRRSQTTWFDRSNRQIRRWQNWAGVGLVLFILFGGIWLALSLPSTKPPPPTNGNLIGTPSSNNTTPTVSKRQQSANNNKPYLNTVPLRQPPPWLELGAIERARLTELWNQRLLPASILLCALLAGLFWWIRRVMFKTLEQRDSEPIVYRLPLTSSEQGITPGLKNAFARLRFQPIATRPDWQKTSRASARQLGFPVLHYKARQRQIDYVMVLDVRHAGDQAAWLIQHLREELRKAQLVVHYYDFDYYPDAVWSAGDRTRQPIPLAQLSTLHPDCRLLLLVEHEVVFYRLSGAPQHWLAQLEQWPDYLLALLSQPTSVEQRRLHQAGYKYRVVTTQDHLTKVLSAIGAPQSSPSPPPLPEFLRQKDQLWRVDQDQIKPLLRQLQDYLNEDGFRLLAGIAMYPKLHGDLTFYLYQTLAGQKTLSSPSRIPLVTKLMNWLGYRRGSAQSERSLDVSSAALLKVVSLPWCRQGGLPEWLRYGVLSVLPNEDYRYLRQFYRVLFSANKGELPTIDQLRLDIHRPPPVNFSRWLKTLINSREPGELHDSIFAKVLLTPRWNPELRLPGNQLETVLPRKVIAKLLPFVQLAATMLLLLGLIYSGWQYFGKNWYGEQLLEDRLVANQQITVTVHYHDDAYPLLEPLGQGLYVLGYRPALQNNNQLNANRIVAPPSLISELERVAKYMSWGESFTLDSEGEEPIIEIARLPQTGAVFQDLKPPPIQVSKNYPAEQEEFWLNTDVSPTSTLPPPVAEEVTVKPILPKMLPIPEGSFMMGSPPDEPGRYDNEGPIHQVTLPAFELAETEVTFAEWDRCVQAGACREVSDRGWGRENRPVINVSWDDTQIYIDWLNQTQGLSGSNAYRLPTEAEWEYAARAGTTTAYYWGDGLQCDYANGADEALRQDLNAEKDRESYAECNDEFGFTTAPVKSFKPNAWNLYDMSGNVWEWTADCWHDNYEGAPSDGSAWEDIGNDSCLPVLRGGGLFNESRALRAAFRYRIARGDAIYSLGFRLARTS